MSKQKNPAGKPCARDLLKLRDVEQIHGVVAMIKTIKPELSHVKAKRLVQKAFRVAHKEWEKHYLPILLGKKGAADFIVKLRCQI